MRTRGEGAAARPFFNCSRYARYRGGRKGDQFVFRATDVRYPFYFLGEMAGKTLATNW